MSHWGPYWIRGQPRFDRNKLYSELASIALTCLKTTTVEGRDLAVALSECMLALVRGPIAQPKASTEQAALMRQAARRLEEVGVDYARIGDIELPTPGAIKEGRADGWTEQRYDDVIASRRFADEVFEARDRLDYALGGQMRRTCFCGKATLSPADHPKGWAVLGSSRWRCPKHAPRPAAGTPVSEAVRKRLGALIASHSDSE